MNASQSQPSGDGVRAAPTEAEPAVPAEAAELLGIVTSRAESFSRKAADDLYAHLLEATQDYLIENALFNIGSRMDGLTRQARHDREAWGKAEARAASLMYALRVLWLATASGTDAQRVSAMSAAGDLLARFGALDAEPKDGTTEQPSRSGRNS